MRIRVNALWSGWLGQMVRFGLTGALNTAFSYAVYTAGVKLGLYAPAAWAIGYALGMALSLTVNTRWTFRWKERLRGGQVAAFLLVNMVSLGASTGMVALLADHYRWNEQWAGLAAAPVSMAINFVGNRIFVYRAGGGARCSRG
ncbi:MAG: GtrA family protein [Oscillospiraceae bacterium]|jgi:putative flippase GtrA|nr:GtrA family protein [Oscillospiraceae bacterium]